jgi:hypothetical protein
MTAAEAPRERELFESRGGSADGESVERLAGRKWRRKLLKRLKMRKQMTPPLEAGENDQASGAPSNATTKMRKPRHLILALSQR